MYLSKELKSALINLHKYYQIWYLLYILPEKVVDWKAIVKDLKLRLRFPALVK